MMHDEHGGDKKILGVPTVDPRFADVTDLQNLPRHWLLEIEDFFKTYKVLGGGRVIAGGWRGAAAAIEVLKKHTIPSAAEPKNPK